jgi:hypothetical protein
VLKRVREIAKAPPPFVLLLNDVAIGAEAALLIMVSAMRFLRHDEKGFQRLLQWLGRSLDERAGGSAAFRSRGAIVMIDSDNIFSGSNPEIYDSTLVPLIFEAYAADLARRVAADNRLTW